jgi:hypothetical protein
MGDNFFTLLSFCPFSSLSCHGGYMYDEWLKEEFLKEKAALFIVHNNQIKACPRLSS